MLISFSLSELFSQPVKCELCGAVTFEYKKSPSRNFANDSLFPILLFPLDPETKYTPEISGVCSSVFLPDSKFHLKCGQESPVKHLL